MTTRHPSTGSTGASGARATTKTFAEKEKLAKARAIKRAERVEARRVKAEEHHKIGNAQFRKRKYCEAIAEYEVAVNILGPTAMYFSNMAAAWLKLGAFDAAEKCANRALALDPTFYKARFRRGQARKGSLLFAAAGIDFATVLKQVPNSTETKNALDEIRLLLRERNNRDLVEQDELYGSPSLDGPKVELESVSDSSDWNHMGNGFPCPSYNHDGCTRGVECEFSHAPDHTSVRDRLGRNVCVFYLLGDCFGPCVYSHDKTCLPSGRWWECEEGPRVVRSMIGWGVVKQDPESLPKCLAAIDGRMAWKPAHAAKTEEAHVWRDRVMTLEGFDDDTDMLKYGGYLTRGMGDGLPSRGGRGGRHDEPELDNFEEKVSDRVFTEDEANLLLGRRPGEEISWDDGIPGHWFEDENWDVFVGVQPI